MLEFSFDVGNLLVVGRGVSAGEVVTDVQRLLSGALLLFFQLFHQVAVLMLTTLLYDLLDVALLLLTSVLLLTTVLLLTSVLLLTGKTEPLLSLRWDRGREWESGEGVGSLF